MGLWEYWLYKNFFKLCILFLKGYFCKTFCNKGTKVRVYHDGSVYSWPNDFPSPPCSTFYLGLAPGSKQGCQDRVQKRSRSRSRSCDHDRMIACDLKNFSWSWSRSQPSLPAIISAIKNFWDIRTTTIVHLLFNTCQLHCNSGGSLWKWRCNLNLKCLQIC